MAPLVFGTIFVELLLVAWIDFKTQKISNLWPLVNIVIAIILHITLKNYYPLAWETFIFPVGFIVIGFILFLLRIMGAGDSKYLASLFLIVPAEWHFLFFEKLILTTILIGSILLLFRVSKNYAQFKAYFISRYWVGLKELIKSRFSYAPVIFVAWILLGVDQWR